MDILGGLTALYFTPEIVLEYFRAHPNALVSNHKRTRELLIGYLLSQFVDSKEHGDLMIGFPRNPRDVARNPRANYTLAEILRRDDLVDDSDIDLVIGNRNIVVRFQLARVVSRGIGRGRKELHEVLEAKIKSQQKDKHLNLVISIEEDTKMVGEKIAPLVLSPQNPYASILLIGKQSLTPGEFNVLQLHPSFSEAKSRRLRLPL